MTDKSQTAGKKFIASDAVIDYNHGMETAPAISWYTTGAPVLGDRLCTTRDIFQARLDRLYRDLLRDIEKVDEISLLIST